MVRLAAGTWKGKLTQMNPLKPKPSILLKLGSIAVHVDEMLSPEGHAFDREAIKSLLGDAEVQAWLRDMDKMAYLPVRRNKPKRKTP
jgi:hypothetical protein